jgi:hypothetical protein
MGFNLETLYPMINRQLQLKPGQSYLNPMGLISPDFDETTEVRED